MNTKVGITLTASDQTKAAFDSVNAGLGALKSRTDGLASAFAGGLGGGLLTGLLGAGFGTAVKNAVDSLDMLDEAAERVGISVEELSALNFAGKMSGLEFEDMTTALTKLSVKMQEAAAGSKEAGALFADVGVKVKDASGKIKPAEQVLKEIAERFAGFEDGAAKTALAVDLFGKSGAKLVPLLNGGAAGLESMRKEAESLGAVIDSKLAKQAAEFNDNMDKLSFLSSNVAKSLVSELIPSLNKTADAMLDAAKNGNSLEAMFRGLIGIAKIPSDIYFSDLTAQFNDLSKSGAIKDLKSEIASLENKIKDGKNGGLIGRLVYGDQKELQQRLEIARNQLAALEKFGDKIFKEPGKSADAAADGKKPIVRTETGDKKPKKERAEIAQASAEATAFAKSMEQLANLARDADAAQLDLTKSQKALYDLMTSAEWGNMPEAWRQTAVAQFEQAQAAELASKAMAESKKLVEEMRTPHEVLADEITRLNKLLDSGAITWETYSRAVFAAQDELDKTNEKAKTTADEMDKFFESAAKNIQGTMADFLFDPFAAGLDGMGQRFGQMIQRMIADAAAAQLAKNLFGTMGQATAGGGAGNWGWVGQAATWVASFFADGGVMTSDGPVPLRKYATGGIANSPQLAMFGEGAQPEAYVPLPDGRRIPVAMQGSNGMTINQTIYAGQGTDSAQVRRSAAAGARAVLGAMNGAQRYA
ncbi:MAG: phage tail tape measure protein [Pseudomonas sp.]|nr:phage tail tape measure protein [Pseudomonas sp.]